MKGDFLFVGLNMNRRKRQKQSLFVDDVLIKLVQDTFTSIIVHGLLDYVCGA